MNSYEIRTDVYREKTQRGSRPVRCYTVWHVESGERVGVRFRTRKQAQLLARLLQATPDLR